MTIAEQADNYAQETRKSYFMEGEHSRRMSDDTFENVVRLAFILGAAKAEERVNVK
jgi:hypothetical protein